MKEEIFKKIKDKYRDYSSFAVWGDDLNDASIIEDNIKDLNPEIIMIGLNISKPLGESWKNFHGGKHDRKLKKAFNNGKYRGAYMTDLIKGVSEPNSKLLEKYLEKPLVDRYISEFGNEIEILQPSNPLIIIFGADGSKLNKVLRDSLSNKYKIKNIYHYSYYGLTDDDWVRDSLHKLSI